MTALLLVAIVAVLASGAAAASGRVRFPAIAGAAAVHNPAARIAAPSRKLGATLAGIAIPVLARSRPGAGRRVWRVGTATS